MLGNTRFKSFPRKRYRVVSWYPRSEFGSPISRPRFYILLVRTELMEADARKDFAAFAKGLLEKMKHETLWDWKLFWFQKKGNDMKCQQGNAV